MTQNCELCGRGTATKTITPTWWPYETVCERARCRQAVHDALTAIQTARDKYDSLVGRVARENHEQTAPVGYRTDAMSDIDINSDEDFWGNQVVKSV